jgi:LysR family glycine cleavage system transcriptional activator
MRKALTDPFISLRSISQMSRVPPLFALRALEASVRHRSYSRAAEELAVTHGAISHHMRRLKDDLGADLFERRGNQMIPTPGAVRLAGEVVRSLDILRGAVGELSGAADRDLLVVSVNTQFATRWLPPRLPRLLADPAGERIEVRVEERNANFVSDGVDMGVRYGAGGWQGLEAVRLFNETLFPVCSPEVAASHPVRRPDDLLDAPLLHHVQRPWSLWFETFGLEPPPQRGLLFHDSLMLLESAAQGLGFALARSAVVEPDLAAGRLVQPFEKAVASELGFHVVWRADSRKHRRICAMRDWLLAEAAA